MVSHTESINGMRNHRGKNRERAREQGEEDARGSYPVTQTLSKNQSKINRGEKEKAQSQRKRWTG